MRNSELKTGIEVFDEKGEVVGTSKVAAKKVSQDVLMCMCSKGPNALYSYGEVWNRNHTTALHYITIISILNDHPQLDRVFCYQQNGLSRMLFFKILTAKMESNILLICMHVAS